VARINAGEYDAIFVAGAGNRAGEELAKWEPALQSRPRGMVVWVDGSDQFGDHSVPPFADLVLRRESRGATWLSTWLERRHRDLKARGWLG